MADEQLKKEDDGSPRSYQVRLGPMEPLPRIVCVHWEDAESKDAWATMDEIMELEKGGAAASMTVGFVLSENPDAIILAASISGNKAADIWRIPKRSIDRVMEVFNGR